MIRIGEWRLSVVGLGGAQWSLTDRPDPAQAIRTIHAAVDAGVRLIDTARAYTTVSDESHNEDLIAAALADHPRRDDVLVATKGGHFRSGQDDFPIDGRPATLRAHCEASLRHLGVQRIGLYQLHHPDPDVPIEESVQALAELRDEGKIALIGVSNVSVSLLRRAQSVTSIASVQNRCSVFHVDDPALLSACREAGMAYLAYSPLGGSRNVAALGRSTAIRSAARAHGATDVQVALAWLRGLDPSIVPIVGTRRPEAIMQAMTVDRIELTAAQRSAITAWVAAAGS